MRKQKLTPERLEQIKALFDAALEIDSGKQKLWLKDKCGSDDDLFYEVSSLLDAANTEDGSGFDSFPAREFIDAIIDLPVIGTRVGAYEIVRQIGSGGMGAVYEGLRVDDQYTKRVAIKFLKRGMETSQSIKRFRHERQILANLNHENIASLLDGGVTDAGHPYFIMEYVDGIPVTEWADNNALKIDARLELLIQICGAVEYAHRNLVIHRDLKPNNILISKNGTVKLLDFGIATLIQATERSEELSATLLQPHAFTPDYSSPEQISGESVSTASDVYSLGVIACELLTGQRPFYLSGKPIAQMQQEISKSEAPLVSSLLNDSSSQKYGGASVKSLKAVLTGDIDSIIAKALRKEKEHRYDSVNQFSLDLKRFRKGLPVQARTGNMSYRIGKFVRRRRLEISVSMIVVLTLAAGVFTTVRQSHKAQIEREKTAQANEFLASMLSYADPSLTGPDVTLRDVLSKAAGDVETKNLDPEVEAQIRHALGQTYYELGLYDSASVHVERAATLRKSIFGMIDNRTSMSLSYLAALYEYNGNLEIADSLGHEVLNIQRKLRPRRDGDLATALDNVSRYASSLGRMDDALVFQLEALKIRRESTDSTALADLSFTLNNLSVLYQYAGDMKSAESMAVEALDAERKLNGENSITYGNLLRNYASVLSELDEALLADSIIKQSVVVLASSVGKMHPDYLRSVSMYATLRSEAEDWGNTETAAQQVIDAVGDVLHESNTQVSVALQHLGLALAARQEISKADSALIKSLELRKQYMPEGHWAVASSESVLGYHYGKTGRASIGIPLLLSAYQQLLSSRGKDAEVTRTTVKRLIHIYEIVGPESELNKWREIEKQS